MKVYISTISCKKSWILPIFNEVTYLCKKRKKNHAIKKYKKIASALWSMGRISLLWLSFKEHSIYIHYVNTQEHDSLKKFSTLCKQLVYRCTQEIVIALQFICRIFFLRDFDIVILKENRREFICIVEILRIVIPILKKCTGHGCELLELHFQFCFAFFLS